MKTPAIALSLILFAASQLRAQAPVDPSFYQIKNVSINLTETSAGSPASPEKPARLSASTDKVVAEMVNTGMAAWKVIVDGKPSGTASSAYASALPPAVYLNWSSVSGWKGPREYTYTYTVTNLMNVDVIKVKYKISYFYGGSEAEGAVKGKYLTNFTVKAMEVKVLWGWGFDMDVKMSHPMNIGTPKNPVASMQADINWSVSTPFSSDGGTWSYGVDAHGNFRDFDAEQKSLTNAIPPLQLSEVPVINWN